MKQMCIYKAASS